MRKFIKDLLFLLEAGKLKMEKVGYTNNHIDNSEYLLAKFLLITKKGPHGYYPIAYMPLSRFFNRVLVDKETHQRIKLTLQEHQALRDFYYNGPKEAAHLGSKLDKMLQDYHDEIMQEGKQITNNP